MRNKAPKITPQMRRLAGQVCDLAETWWGLPEFPRPHLEQACIQAFASVVEEQQPKQDELAHQVAVASENVAGWPEWKRNGSTASPKPSADLEKVAEELIANVERIVGAHAWIRGWFKGDLLLALSSAVAERDERIRELTKLREAVLDANGRFASEAGELKAALAASQEALRRIAKNSLQSEIPDDMRGFGSALNAWPRVLDEIIEIAREALKDTNVPSPKTPVLGNDSGADSGSRVGSS